MEIEIILRFLAIITILIFYTGYIELLDLTPYWIIRPRIEEKALKKYKKYIRSLKCQK